MRILGNILWFIFGGLELGLVFIGEGLLCMLSLIGIPFGIQWFKMVPLVFVPFGKGIRYPKVTGGKVFGNVLWAIFFGWWNGIVCFLVGLICFITIVGIPFGKQWWKLARLMICPFGAEVYNEVAEKKQEKRARKREEKLVREAATAAAVAAASAVAAQNNSSVPLQNPSQPAMPAQNSPSAFASPSAAAQAQNTAPVSMPAAVSGKWICFNCGKSGLDEDSMFCENCGTPKPQMTAPQNAPAAFAAPSVAAPAQNTAPAGLSAAASGTWVCPNCGASGLDENSMFCENCGTPKPQLASGNAENSVDFKDKAADIGKKTAETAAAVGAKVSDVTTNTIVPFFKGKFVPAMKKFGSWIKKQFVRFGYFLRMHKEQIKKAMPVVSTVVIGVAAVILIVIFAVNASEKGKIIGEYNAEKSAHDEAVEEAQATINEYNEQAEDLNDMAAEMEQQIAQKNEEDRSLDSEISELEAEISQKEKLQSEMTDSISGFKGIGNGYSTAEYAEKQLSEMIISQQQRIYDLKNAVADHIESLYFYLSDDWDSSNFSFEVAEPADITDELTKEIIRSVAGEFDSEIADIAAGVITDVMDGTDITSSIGSQIQGAVQDKISDLAVSALDSATGGMYSKFSEAADVVGTFEDVYNKLSDTTPGYCVNHIYHEMEQCVTEMCVFIDNESVDTNDIASLMDTINKLCLLEYSCNDILGELRADYAGALILNDSVQNAYNSIITDNEQMAYYFALMEG